MKSPIQIDPALLQSKKTIEDIEKRICDIPKLLTYELYKKLNSGEFYERYVDKYLFLIANPPSHERFSRVFNRDFPKGNGVPSKFYTEFFSYLNQHYKSNKTTIEIYKDIYVDGKLDPCKGQKDFRMNEISKLSHFISKYQRPIWSSATREFFYFKKFVKQPDNTLQQIIKLEEFFDRIMYSSNYNDGSCYDLSIVLNRVREVLDLPDSVSNVKILDILIWQSFEIEKGKN